MAEISYTQKSFLGGEWSPYFQGRTDHPKYVQALNLSRNGLPIEEGTWLRRPGSRLKAPTYQNKPGRLYSIEFAADQPYDVEFTDGWIRFYSGHNLVFTVDGPQAVTSISTANPALLTLTSAVDWATGDEIYFSFDAAHPTGSLPLRQRSFIVTKSTTSTFTLTDGLTGATIDGSTLSITAGTVIKASRVLRLATPYIAGAWATCRIVQNQDFGLVLNRLYLPYVLTIGPGSIAGTAFATFQKVQFIDGPYLDPVNNSQIAFEGGTLTGPAPWDASISYHGGAVVELGNLYYLYAPINFFPGVTSPVGVAPPSAGWYLVSASGAGAGINGSVTITASFGAWDATKPYNLDDYVSYAGASYRSLQQGNINQNPATQTAYWATVPVGTEVTGPHLTYGQTPGFQATDVGRHVRIWSQPPLWDSTVVYHVGDVVTYNDAVYVSNDPNTNNLGVNDVPGRAVNLIGQSLLVTGSGPGGSIVPTPVWSLQVPGDYDKWSGGVITQVLSSVSAIILIEGTPLPIYSPTKDVPLTAPEPAPLWRLGVYSDTTAYPSCGSFYEGRFWFGGAIPNRFDTSKSQGFDQNGAIFMAPTLEDGTVTDANGISYTLEGRDTNEIFWLEPDHNGIMFGTLGGEWLIQASTLSDPITPTSIQAKRVTKYGCANIEPKRTGISLVFIQKFKRRVMEFLADVFTGRYIAPHLNEAAKHLTTAGVAELGYQEELAPVLWARTGESFTTTTVYTPTEVSTNPVTWNPADTHYSIDLSNGNLTGTGQGGYVGVAIDVTNSKVWFYSPLFDRWNGDILANQNPITGVGGFTWSGIPGSLFPFWSCLDDGTPTWWDSVIANFGATAFRHATPTGFSSWNALAGVTTWDAASATGTIVLSGGNLRATGSTTNSVWKTVRGNKSLGLGKAYFELEIVVCGPGGDEIIGFGNSALSVTGVAPAATVTNAFGVRAQGTGYHTTGWADGFGALYAFGDDWHWRLSRATLSRSTGKYYFEYSADTVLGAGADLTNGGMMGGLATAAATLGDKLGASTTSVGYRNNNLIYYSGSTSSITDTYTNGDVIGVAVDLDAHKVWFYNPHGARWNGDILANQNPVTGDGGWDISAGVTGSVFPAFAVYDPNFADVLTGNFSGKVVAFSYAIPTGFLAWDQSYIIVQVPSIGYTITAGGLIGATYRRVSAFTTEVPAFVGWHRHDLGHARGQTSIAVGPTGDGTLDNLDMVTTDGTNYYVEGLTQIFDEDDDLTDGWFVDGGLVPDSAYADTYNPAYSAWSGSLTYAIGAYVNDNNVSYVATAASHAIEPGVTTGWQSYWSVVTGVHFTGLNWLIGKTVAVCAFGLDLGDYTVYTNGEVFVPYGNGTAPALFDYTVAGAGHYLFTASYITNNLLTLEPRNGGVPYSGKFMPAVVGYTYTSQGQLLRPSSPETSGTRAGPAMGKKRRSHLFVGLFHNTIGVQVGTDFANKILPANFKDDGDTLFPPDQMYSGTWRNTVESDYDFDSMITWQILRPYPASVVSLGAMLKTQDV